jgi:hypothetical protein
MQTIRVSQHRALFAWLAILLAFGLLMVVARWRHAGFNGPAFPNRVDTESDRASEAGQNAGQGDVGDVGQRR